MMTMEGANAWVVILVGLTTAIVTVITAWKVQKVHTLVNSNLASKEAEIVLLRNLLIGRQLQSDIAERSRLALADAAALAVSQVATDAANQLAAETRRKLGAQGAAPPGSEAP